MKGSHTQLELSQKEKRLVGRSDARGHTGTALVLLTGVLCMAEVDKAIAEIEGAYVEYEGHPIPGGSSSLTMDMDCLSQIDYSPRLVSDEQSLLQLSAASQPLPQLGSETLIEALNLEEEFLEIYSEPMDHETATLLMQF